LAGGPFGAAEESSLGATEAGSTGSLSGTTAAGADTTFSRGLEAVLQSDTRTFTRYLESLQSQAAQSGTTMLTPADAQALWESAVARGFTAPRGIESKWVGGPHINIIGPGGGPNIHFPVPFGWQP
jgi:hypothetical protein